MSLQTMTKRPASLVADETDTDEAPTACERGTMWGASAGAGRVEQQLSSLETGAGPGS